MYHKYSEFCRNTNMIQNVPGFVDYTSLPVSNQVFYVEPEKEQAVISPDIPEEAVSAPDISYKMEEPIQESTTTMLPVLDTQFNLREICKQCILCEDHLSHQEKMCRDCIMKHFLALEGLAEEAITLDKNFEYPDIVSLPTDLREIQKSWFSGEKTPHECSQALRKIRKSLMESTFPVIFGSSCSSGVCTTK
jgi:acetone carboxylase gamma subunit